MSQLQAVRKKQMRTKSYSSNQNTFDEKRSDKAEKQIKAMERAGIDYPRLTIVETVARLAIRLLPSENKEP